MVQSLLLSTTTMDWSNQITMKRYDNSRCNLSSPGLIKYRSIQQCLIPINLLPKEGDYSRRLFTIRAYFRPGLSEIFIGILEQYFHWDRITPSTYMLLPLGVVDITKSSLVCWKLLIHLNGERRGKSEIFDLEKYFKGFKLISRTPSIYWAFTWNCLKHFVLSEVEHHPMK